MKTISHILKGLMEEYIKTINNYDDKEQEFCMSMHEYAVWQIIPFLKWIENQDQGDQDNE